MLGLALDWVIGLLGGVFAGAVADVAGANVGVAVAAGANVPALEAGILFVVGLPTSAGLLLALGAVLLLVGCVAGASVAAAAVGGLGAVEAAGAAAGAGAANFASICVLGCMSSGV